MDNIREDLIDLLSELIGVYSPYFKEEELMDLAHGWLKDKNIPVEYHRYTEDKVTNFNGVNLIGKIKGNGKGPKIHLNGHLDTVTITQGWSKDPLKASIEGDKLYGLGALDMKSGCAAMIIALEAFVKNVNDFNGEIVYSFVSDEEGPYGLGTDAIIRDGLIDDVDLSIIPEPSSGFADVEFPCLCLGARGGYNYKVSLQGKASHAANPELGINAIVDAAKLITELESLTQIQDPKLGKGSLVVIDIEGGGAAASTAEKASFSVFRHTVRGETKDTLMQEVDQAAKRANIRSQYKLEFRDAPYEEVDGFDPYVVDEDNEYTKLLQESIKEVTGHKGNIAYFSSIGDFNYLGTRIGAPAFIFGASGKNYHAADEWVSIDSLVKTTQVIYDLLVRLTK